ncbi:ATP synthase A1 subunit C [Candidatus Woesearchaeota archaeon]|nr:ATP synthase A1 subunit C [Candidatus Woesearchaeota archaeon]
MAKIKLSTYPYTYVRVVAMRSKLLSKDDYHKLVRMKLGEIARYLQESEYKREIDELGIKFSGAFLLELAIHRNLIRNFQKLRRISNVSSNELLLLIDNYLVRSDIWNIKTVLRAKFTGISEAELLNIILPIGKLSEEHLISLFRKDSVEEIIKSVDFIKFKAIKPALDYFREKKSFLEIENFLDKYYYSQIIAFAQKIPKEGELFREFLMNEIFIQNTITVLRMKRSNIKPEDIRNFIIMTGERSFDRPIEKLLRSENFEEMISGLEKSKFGNYIKEGLRMYKEKMTLVYLEADFMKYLLKRSALLLHQNPLSASVILGYMMAKEIEVKNIGTIIKGKELGLSDEFVENSLVIA